MTKSGGSGRWANESREEGAAVVSSNRLRLHKARQNAGGGEQLNPCNDGINLCASRKETQEGKGLTFPALSGRPMWGGQERPIAENKPADGRPPIRK